MLEIHPTLLAYQGAIFLVFAFLMWKFVYKALVKMVEERRQRIERTMLEAEQKRGEADSLRLGLEGRVAELNARAEEIIRQAEAEAFIRREEIVEQGRSEANRIAETKRLHSQAELEEAVLAAKGEMLDLAGSLARRALDKAVTPEVDARLVQELSAEIEKAEWTA